ncbi:MAG: NAD(+)/NADH kinase [Erysipelotrichaceae bacterium]|nr:NAD(+)/NADH kinase [Erysipelotrichaceae bacterium]
MIRKVKLCTNHSKHSEQIKDLLKQKLLENGFTVSDTDFELAIAIGGDGSFLHMVKDLDFSLDKSYIGIHTGKLGFLQNVNESELDDFLQYLKNDCLVYNEADIQLTIVETLQGTKTFLSMNEVVIRKEDLKTMYMDIYVNDDLLEHFAGDGILVSTSVGSTAYNMSFRGSIVDPDLKTMQITAIAPLNNKHYENLMSSVIIPDYKVIRMEIPAKNVLLTVDGENNVVKDVTSVTVEILPRRLQCLRFRNQPFTKKITDKLLTK